MFLGVDYEDVAAFIDEEDGITNERIFEIAEAFGSRLEEIEDLPYGPALLTVESLEQPGEEHLVYWDGTNLLDPAKVLKHYVMPDELMEIFVTI
jgi:hypothetical protein